MYLYLLVVIYLVFISHQILDSEFRSKSKTIQKNISTCLPRKGGRFVHSNIPTYSQGLRVVSSIHIHLRITIIQAQDPKEMSLGESSEQRSITLEAIRKISKPLCLTTTYKSKQVFHLNACRRRRQSIHIHMWQRSLPSKKNCSNTRTRALGRYLPTVIHSGEPPRRGVCPFLYLHRVPDRHARRLSAASVVLYYQARTSAQ